MFKNYLIESFLFSFTGFLRDRPSRAEESTKVGWISGAGERPPRDREGLL